MTDAPSTVPAAKASLFALLGGSTPATYSTTVGLEGVTVDYGDPGVDKIEREHIFLGDTTDDAQGWAPYGRLKRDEHYGIGLYVHVANPGWTQQQATERVYALAGVIEVLLRPLARHATALAAGMYAVEFVPGGLSEYVTDQGYAAFLSNHIACKARI